MNRNLIKISYLFLKLTGIFEAEPSSPSSISPLPNWSISSDLVIETSMSLLVVLVIVVVRVVEFGIVEGVTAAAFVELKEVFK